MFFKSLEFFNWGPFKDLHTIYLDPGIILIQGEYESNPIRSNRAGKTSFVEGIPYVLYGYCRTREVDMIHAGADRMHVKGVIDLDGKEIAITRGRTRDNKPFLDITGLEGTNTMKDKELSNLLQLSFDEFLLTYWFKQNDIHGFISAPPSEKKWLLQKWFKLDRWEGYENKAKQNKNTFDAEIALLQARRMALQDQTAQLTISPEEEVYVTTRYSEVSKKLVEEKVVISELNLKLAQNSNEDVLADIKDKELNITTTNRLLQELLQKKDNTTASLTKYKESMDKLNEGSSLIQERMDKLHQKLLEASKAIESVRGRVDDKSSLLARLRGFQGICPIDCKECDKGTRIPDYQIEVQRELEALTMQISINNVIIDSIMIQIRNDKEKFVTSRALEKTINDCKAAGIDPEVFSNYIESLLTHLGRLNSSYNELKAKAIELDQVSTLKQELKSHMDIEIGLNNQYKEIVENIGRIKTTKDMYARLSNEILDIASTLEVKRKEQLKWSYLANILGKDGIPYMLMENSISSIENFTNSILEMISPTTKIEFTTTRETTTKQSHCEVCGSIFTESRCHCGYGVRKNKIKDEINLKILDCNNTLNFNQDSGGGQVLLSIAIRLALTQLLMNQSVSKSEFLILDEVFGSLDEVNREYVSRMIFTALKRLLGFQQIFVITHTPINESTADQIIKIIRNDNFSKISVDKPKRIG